MEWPIIAVVVLFGIICAAEENNSRYGPSDGVENVTPEDELLLGNFTEMEMENVTDDALTCGSPPLVEGTVPLNLEGTLHAIGTEITYKCDFGYVYRLLSPRGYISTCELDEQSWTMKWTEPSLLCIPRPCGDPGDIQNAERIGDVFTFPHQVEFRCSEGYRLKGQGVRFCQASGEWSGRLPRCEKITCAPPTDPANGRVSYATLEYGAELSYKCDSGFLLKNHPQIRFCTSDGTWSNSDPLCGESRCDEPVAPKHGQVQLLGDSKVNSLVRYSCDEDRKLEGASMAKCLETGQWTFPAPKCLGRCSVPAVANGSIGRYEQQQGRYRMKEVFVELETGTSLTHGETVKLRCKEKFLAFEDAGETDFRRSVDLQCVDGNWSKNVHCNPSQCLGEPPAMQHGQAVVSNRSHGFVIWYACDKNYVKVKTGHVQCVHGTWTGNTPVCVDGKTRNRCYSRALNVTGLVRPSVEYIGSRRSLLVSCADGYTTSGVQYLSCNAGKWEIPKDACVEASCSGDPTPVQNGRYSLPSRDPGSEVKYECIPPFELSAEAKVLCRQGKWTGQPPSCVDPEANHQDPPTESSQSSASIPAAKKPTQPSTNKERNPGLSADCFCSYLHHDRSLIARVREREGSLRHGDLVRKEDSAWLTCRDPQKYLRWSNGLLTDSGPIELTCSECIAWEARHLPSCTNLQPGDAWITWKANLKVLPSGAVQVERNENINVSCHNWDVGYPVWSTPISHDVFYSYNAVGMRRRYNSWFAVPKTQTNQEGVYSCSVIDADRKSYRPSHFHLTIKAKVVCPRIKHDGDLIITYNDSERSENSMALFLCKNMEQKTVGPSNRTCQHNGKWSEENPTCVDITCPEIVKSEGLEVTYTKGRKPLSFARFHCMTPATLEGGSSSMCRYNGSWSIPPPTCSVPGCLIGDLMESIVENLVPDMESVSGELQSVGSKLPLLCEQNLVLTGQKHATCGPDGKWSIGDAECVTGCYFTEEVLSTSLEIDPRKEFYRFGEFALFSCPDGRELTIDVERVMCIGSDWSNAIPQCREIAAQED